MHMNLESSTTTATRGRSWRRVVGIGLIAGLIAVGLWFRFTAMDQKYFWLDEVHAALLRSGYSEHDLHQLFDDRPRRLADLQQFVRLDPQQPFSTTVATLASRHPVHPPLYYSLLRAWTIAAGDSVAATRLLSALCSLLCFPAIYWLARELFRARAAAWTAVVLWSVSPFAVLYAQEAKQYSLFAATTMFACAALLRAVRLGSRGAWAWYAVATAVGLYTHLLFAAVLAAFTAFVFLLNVGRLRRPRTRRMLRQFTAATGAAVVTFVPWIAYCLSIGGAGQHIVRTHMADQQKLAWVVGAWVSNLGCTFSDLGYPATLLGACLRVGSWFAVIGLTIYALRFLQRKAPRRQWLFLLLLTVTPAMVLMIPDLVLGGGRSMIARYWTATSIGMLLAVAGVLGRQFSSSTALRRNLAWGTACTLVLFGLCSCAVSCRADYWWNKMGVVNNHRNGALEYAGMVRFLNVVDRASNPLIVTEVGQFQECRLLSFTYYLQRPDVEWVGTLDPQHLALPDDKSIFLFEAPATLEMLRSQGWKFTALDPLASFVYATRETSPRSDDGKTVDAASPSPPIPEVVRNAGP